MSTIIHFIACGNSVKARNFTMGFLGGGGGGGGVNVWSMFFGVLLEALGIV